jgi:undecaprenyl-diphosphatase
MTIPAPASFSFPSGHTASSMACARILALLGPWAALPAYAYALLMGCSRVYLRVHYVSDVVAGGLVGLLCGEITRRYIL